MHVLLVDYNSGDYELPSLFGPFRSVEGAQAFAEIFRVANNLPREATPENNEEWTEAGWYFGIFELSMKIETWSV